MLITFSLPVSIVRKMAPCHPAVWMSGCTVWMKRKRLSHPGPGIWRSGYVASYVVFGQKLSYDRSVVVLSVGLGMHCEG